MTYQPGYMSYVDPPSLAEVLATEAADDPVPHVGRCRFPQDDRPGDCGFLIDEHTDYDPGFGWTCPQDAQRRESA